MVFEFESFKRISLFLVQLGEKSLKQYQRGQAFCIFLGASQTH